MNIFEEALRIKARFPFKALNLTAEDLWTLPLTHSRSANLDDIYKAVNAEVKGAEEESYVKRNIKGSRVANLKLKVLKYIIDAKLDEKREAVLKEEKRKKLLKVQTIREKKVDSSLEELSLAELDRLEASLKE